MARVNSLMVSYWQYSESLPTHIAVNNNLEQITVEIELGLFCLI